MNWLKTSTATFLAVLTVVFCFLLFIYCFTVEFSDKQEKVIMFILGNIISILSMIFQYYFGSSKSSSEKNDMLKKMINGAGEDANKSDVS